MNQNEQPPQDGDQNFRTEEQVQMPGDVQADAPQEIDTQPEQQVPRLGSTEKKPLHVILIDKPIDKYVKGVVIAAAAAATIAALSFGGYAIKYFADRNHYKKMEAQIQQKYYADSLANQRTIDSLKNRTNLSDSVVYDSLKNPAYAKRIFTQRCGNAAEVTALYNSIIGPGKQKGASGYLRDCYKAVQPKVIVLRQPKQEVKKGAPVDEADPDEAIIKKALGIQ